MSVFTPSKKGMKSTSGIVDDHDRVSQARDKIAKRLRPKGRLPYLNNLVNAVEELLDANLRILERCKQAIDTDGQKLVPYSVFTKRTFKYVKSRSVGGKAQFIAYPEFSEMIFDITPLIKLPSKLAIVPHETFQSGLIKYEVLFESSLLLHDNVLVPFLSKLKGHLGLVQASLNKIDEWLSQSVTNVNLLEAVFGIGAVKKAEQQYRENPLCRNCFYSFKSHNRRGSYTACKDGSTRYKRSRAFLLKEYVTTRKIKHTYSLYDAVDEENLLKLTRDLSSK